jgi:putative ABC transport system substrate-binding protein
MKQIRIFTGVVALLITFCISVEAQPTKSNPRLCYVGSRVSSDAQWLNEFRAGLSELGYTEGRNITIEYRYWEGQIERLTELTDELIRLNCDVLITGGIEAAEAAKNATKTVPIVMAFSGADPVRRGIIASFAHPGGNITGLASIGGQLSGKRLELLKEAIPNLSRVAMLLGPASEPTGLRDAEAVARVLRITIQPLEAKTGDELEAAFKTANKEHMGAVMVHPGGFVGFHAKRIVELAEKYRLPAIYPSLTFSESGALMIYAEERSAHFRRAAWYVDRILKRVKPAELPVEQPKKFFLVINLNAARRIRLTIPPNVLARADRVIR